MTEPSARNLVTELVSAFGDADAIAALLAPDAQWWITPSVGVMGSPTIGRGAIREALQVIFGQLYVGVRTTVHDVLADEHTGAARFTMSATALFADGRLYENEYCVWIRAESGRILRVWEYLDAAHAAGQFGITADSSTGV
jgi:ketosteroid isomerase-like protein